MRYFPSGIAEGDAFCNRVEERKQLKGYIERCQHTVIMGPRRYGKSSLITQVIRNNKFKHVWVDFLSVTTKDEAEERVRLAVKQLLLLLSPELKKLQIQTIDQLKALSPELNLSAMGQTLTLSLSANKTIPIDEALTQIDLYAQKMKKTAVLVFDEFQQISELKENQAVEALIRHAVERSKAIVYVFSGSNRHMLKEMFSQSSRPLYRLCSIMPIDRIQYDDYAKFINHAARQRWKEELKDEIIGKIISLTERHPFYLNILCGELWSNESAPTDVKAIESVWRSYILQHKSIVVSEIVPLPINQKKVLKALSNNPESEPYGAAFSIKLKISAASVRRALEALLLKDCVYEDENSCYRVLDPAISYYFKFLY